MSSASKSQVRATFAREHRRANRDAASVALSRPHLLLRSKPLVAGLLTVAIAVPALSGCGEGELSDARLDPQGGAGTLPDEPPVADASLAALAAADSAVADGAADPGSDALDTALSEADLGEFADDLAAMQGAMDAFAHRDVSVPADGGDAADSGTMSDASLRDLVAAGPPVAYAGAPAAESPQPPRVTSGTSSTNASPPPHDLAGDAVAAGPGEDGIAVAGEGATSDQAQAPAESTQHSDAAPAITQADREAELQTTIDNLIRELSTSAADSPDALRLMLAASALEALSDPEAAGATSGVLNASNLYGDSALEALPMQHRAVLHSFDRFFTAAGRYAELDGDPARFVPAIDALHNDLAAPPNLTISTFTLCSSVTNYGYYTELPQHAFVRGQPARMFAYVEVDHFKPVKKSDSNLFATRLTLRLDLFAPDGTVVHVEDAETVEDLCRKPRRDFFLVRPLALPTNLNVGRYSLKARIRDEATGAEAEAIHPITIIATSTVSTP